MDKDDKSDSASPILVLFRDDLRLSDNQALHTAVLTGRPIVCAFVFDEAAMAPQQRGAATLWWLHHSIEALCSDLAARGGCLLLFRGAHRDVVDDLVRATGADTVCWNRRYHPKGIDCDTALKAHLRAKSITVESHAGHLLHEPGLVKTGAGGSFRVYTPFWKAVSALDDFGKPLPAPKSVNGWTGEVQGDRLEAWKLLPTKPDWAGGMRSAWTPGETGARELLDRFFDTALAGYGDARDIPGHRTTSRLSPHLAHGEISPRTIWTEARRQANAANSGDVEKFRKELVWREFSYHLLFHNHDLDTVNFSGRFDAFPWRSDPALLMAWQRGVTGYPIVDAGMRELWQTGWMHNRVRMICASFLIKHLLVDWRDGEKWFADTLVDADPANNPASWQWVAGSGADAAPYFRIFNPIMQGEKFDADGAYVRRFVPEVAALPNAFIHKPWEAPRGILAQAGVELGKIYPHPIVDHQQARNRALNAFESLKGAA